jgi:hypothetical protein
MPHALFQHDQAVKEFAAIDDLQFRFAQQRAAIFGPFWPSHDISVQETVIPQ